jgi:hypothetical protein
MMRIPVLFVLALVLSMPKPCLGDEPNAKSIPTADKLAELKMEWEQNSAVCAKLLETQYEAGTIDFDRFCAKKSFFLKTKLEMTEKPDDRIGAFQDHLKIAEKVFEFVEKRHENGISTEADLRKAKAELLKIKIQLARESSEKKDSNSEELEHLRKEQIENLTTLDKLLTVQYQAGTIPLERLVQAKETLCRLKLDSTTKPAERIALLDENLKYFSSFFEDVERRHRGGVVTERDLLQAKALLQNIEIQLAKEPSDGNNSSLSANLGELEKSRVDTLSNLVKITHLQFKAGNGDIDQLLRFQQELQLAQLESAKKPEERIVLLEEQCKDSHILFDFVEQKFKSGILTELDYCQAKAAMIALDYRLPQERTEDKRNEPSGVGP